MSLETYRRKRDFGRTPEPSGDGDGLPGAAPPENGRRFVVQRHRATRLHYDFRLEMDGVLVSWAVPRGPSLKPLERRMAAHVEDHPLEYFDFEGIIPRGEYGAGDVIVWDWGTWEPEGTDDPGAAVRSGELKFRLSGEKLRGRFVIVRTRGGDYGKDDWLLMHKRDEDAQDDWDVDVLPRSVKSGRTNDEVKAGAPALWVSGAPAAEAEIDLSGARSEAQPEFVSPMLATLADRPFSDPQWLFELKLDGYRIVAVVRDGSVRLWTRNRQDGARWFPRLAAAKPTWIAASQAIVDGEVAALGADGKPSFSLLQDLAGMKGFGAARGERRPEEEEAGDEPGGATATKPKGALVYHVFDLLHYEGKSLVDVPLEERKRLLKSLVRDHSQVRYLTHVVEDGEAFHEAAAAQELEGIIAKLRASRYEPGRRSRAWLKIKIRREQELVVIGYEPGKGTHRELGALLVAVHDGGALRYAGEVGSGIDTRQRAAFRSQLDALARDDPPAADVPRLGLAGARWAEPKLVIRAEFSEWTSDDLLRQAAFKGLEPDKDWHDVIRERPLQTDEAVDAAAGGRRSGGGHAADRTPQHKASAPQGAGRRGGRAPSTVPSGGPAQTASAEELAALDAMSGDGVWRIGGHELNVTNLDKVLFPEAGYTKRDLIRYYVTVAPVLLPHLRERPLNVDRWPNGVTGPHFWQKQIPSHAPTWVERWDYPEAGKNESHTYVVCDRVATLAWLANQACIDLHPWTSRLPEWHRPTFALIDIDPGPKTSWEEVLVLARLYRAALEHLGLVGLPKVTGKRGIQVWVPIEQRYTFDETRIWVEGLSRAVGSAVPDLVSWEWDRSRRSGRARLDFTQNAVNKTLVAPYAVRPVTAAGVSMPIRWDELEDPTLRPDRWDLRSALARVNEVGDLFAAAATLRQRLPNVE
jgi:bifunctional non-homologous end joining protein LigD